MDMDNIKEQKVEEVSIDLLRQEYALARACLRWSLIQGVVFLSAFIGIIFVLSKSKNPLLSGTHLLMIFALFCLVVILYGAYVFQKAISLKALYSKVEKSFTLETTKKGYESDFEKEA